MRIFRQYTARDNARPELDDRLRRLYKLVEDGRDDADDILKARIADLRLTREKALAALDRAKLGIRPVQEISPILVDRFTRTMREKLTTGDIPSARPIWARS